MNALNSCISKLHMVHTFRNVSCTVHGTFGSIWLIKQMCLANLCLPNTTDADLLKSRYFCAVDFIDFPHLGVKLATPIFSEC